MDKHRRLAKGYNRMDMQIEQEGLFNDLPTTQIMEQ
jgi:hypothetical protein